MDKIIVTEEQAEIIEKYKGMHHAPFEVAFNIAFCLNNNRTAIDLVTIARIAEGESYKIKKEFKVGDIVRHKDNEYPLLANNINLSNINNDNYILICKAENREDDLETDEIL